MASTSPTSATTTTARLTIRPGGNRGNFSTIPEPTEGHPICRHCPASNLNAEMVLLHGPGLIVTRLLLGKRKQVQRWSASTRHRSSSAHDKRLQLRRNRWLNPQTLRKVSCLTTCVFMLMYSTNCGSVDIQALRLTETSKRQFHFQKYKVIT